MRSPVIPEQVLHANLELVRPGLVLYTFGTVRHDKHFFRKHGRSAYFGQVRPNVRSTTI